MEKKKSNNLFKRIFISLLIIFMCLYSVSLNGYKNRETEYKTLYTQEMIEKFEHDVSEGKELDIDEYLNYEEKDYSNKISNLGEKVSEGIDFMANKSLKIFSEFFNYLFY